MGALQGGHRGWLGHRTPKNPGEGGNRGPGPLHPASKTGVTSPQSRCWGSGGGVKGPAQNGEGTASLQGDGRGGPARPHRPSCVHGGGHRAPVRPPPGRGGATYAPPTRLRTAAGRQRSRRAPRAGEQRECPGDVRRSTGGSGPGAPRGAAARPLELPRGSPGAAGDRRHPSVPPRRCAVSLRRGGAGPVYQPLHHPLPRDSPQGARPAGGARLLHWWAVARAPPLRPLPLVRPSPRVTARWASVGCGWRERCVTPGSL